MSPISFSAGGALRFRRQRNGTMNAIEKPVGYDCRDLTPAAWESWTRERREMYLLGDAEKPLSTDLLVWPSAFGRTLKAPDWTGILGLWSSLPELDGELKKVESRLPRPSAVIAISLAWDLLTAA
jgi:hypothetical protein